jgi:homoserine kinase type II
VAVYTHVSAEQVDALLQRYDVGTLTALKGIAEGVENSNYLVETDRRQFILTLYENRVDPADLPYFHSLLAKLHQAGCLVPRFIEDNSGEWLQDISGRKGCLIEFLSGISVSHPTALQAKSVGQSLAQMHNALFDFAKERPNPLGIAEWNDLFERCDRAQTEALLPGLAERLAKEFAFLDANWPHELPKSAIHADLFPDNVLMLGDTVTGLIDFYFACSEIRAFDIAVTHAAWAFSADGQKFEPAVGNALLAGYQSVRPISDEERTALPILARGACIRFLLTRLYDWINTPAGAVVTRKDPLAFLRRLDHYCEAGDTLWAPERMNETD